MIKQVTSVTMFQAAVGLRMSITYAEIDEETGTVIADNKRIDKVVTERATKDLVGDLFDYAQAYVDTK